MFTTRLLGVFPLLGLTESHVRPIGLVLAVALNVSGTVGLLLVREITCVVCADPAKAVTLMDGTPTFRSGLVLTLRVTGTVSGEVRPGDVNVKVPVHVCVVVRPAVLTATVT